MQSFEDRLVEIKARYEKNMEKQKKELEREQELSLRESRAKRVEPEVDINGRHRWPFSKMEVGDTFVFHEEDFHVSLTRIQMYAATYGRTCYKKFSTHTIDGKLFVTRAK